MDRESPRLRVQGPDGPGKEIALQEFTPCGIGRAPWNELVLSAPGTSRRHARIEFRQDRWWVEDLGSHNGTLLNGDRLREPTALRPGDEIRVSGYSIRFLAGETTGPVRFSGSEEATLVTAASIERILDRPPPVIADTIEPTTAEPGGRFGRLDRVGAALLEHCPRHALPGKIVDLVCQLLSPDRAALLAPNAETGELSLLAACGPAGAGDEVKLSRSIVRRALEGKEAVLVADAGLDPALSARESIIHTGISSVLCAPLWAGDEVTGLLYADRRGAATPFTEDDMHQLALLGHLAAVKLRETEALAELQRREQLAEELGKAARIQQQLLPEGACVRDRIVIAGQNLPCLSVGGDYFDYRDCPDGAIVVALGDVSGKGLPAALLMSNLHAMVRTLCATGAHPVAMAGYLNDALNESLQGERFATMFLGRVDPDSGRLEYVNAGHSPGLLARADGDVVELVTGGKLLGPFPNTDFAAREIDLAPGDLLLLTSDGVTEAESPDEEEFGEDRLCDFLRANRELEPEALSAALMDAVHAFTSPRPPGDDVTVLALRWT